MLADVMHHIRFLVTNTTTLALVMLLVVAAAATWWIRHTGRSSRPYPLLFAAIASLTLIITLTLVRDLLYYLVRDGLHFPFTPGQLFIWSLDGWRRISYDPLGDSEVLLNIALFVPAGVAWTLLTGKPPRVFAALVGLSFLVECLQAVTGAGANDVADLVTNSVGAALGVLAGAIVLWLAPRIGRRSRPTPRQAAVGTGTVVAVAMVAVVALHIGAAHRQAALEQELIDLFSGTTLEQYRTWEAEDRLSEEVFGAASVFVSGGQDFDDLVRVRYPASFFGLHRCVFVEWTPRSIQVYRGAGADCTEFIG